MYYFKIGISILFIIIFIVSLVYTLVLSIKVAAKRIERKEAMRKSFAVSFLTFMFMFIVYLIWQDLSNLDIQTWILVIIFITGFSIFGGLTFAVSLWNWKNKS